MGDTLLSGPALGQALALLSATAFAFAHNFIARTTGSRGDKGVLFSVLVTMLISGLIWVLFGAPLAQVMAAPGIGSALFWFALGGILSMVFGRSLVFAAIRGLGVTRSAAVQRLNPFFSVLLAAILLAEPLSRNDLLGVALIALSFALVLQERFRRHGPLAVAAPPLAAYLLGVGGALAYALAYVTRKLGLEQVDSAAFGTFVSASAGFAGFATLALISARYRRYFQGIFANLDRWTILAAIMVSFGQILLFAALSHERVSTVVMIASLEIFISMFLSVVVFRSERLAGPAILLAAALALGGVVLVASQ
jgi:drug/metabolite transporter (DMT)-like permease